MTMTTTTIPSLPLRLRLDCPVIVSLLVAITVAVTPVLANLPAANLGPGPFRGRHVSAFAGITPGPGLAAGRGGRGYGGLKMTTIGRTPLVRSTPEASTASSVHRFPLHRRMHFPANVLHPARVSPSTQMSGCEGDDGDDDHSCRMGRGRGRNGTGRVAAAAAATALYCHRVAGSVASRLRVVPPDAAPIRRRRWKLRSPLGLSSGGTGAVAIGEGGGDDPAKAVAEGKTRGGGGRSDRSARPRPEWACDWMPTWLITMRPLTQFTVGAALYVFHLTVLTQHGVAFPFQLIPNDDGHFQSIGLDSLAGMASLAGWAWLRRRTRDRPVPAVPPLWEEPYYDEVPWAPVASLRRRAVTSGGRGGDNDGDAENGQTGARKRYEDTVYSTMRAAFWLLASYGATGQFAMWCESMLYRLAGLGVPMTVAMHRSLVVLLGHLCWVGVGCLILKLELTPNFFRERVPKGKGRGWGAKKRSFLRRKGSATKKDGAASADATGGVNDGVDRTQREGSSSHAAAESDSDDSSPNTVDDGGSDRTSSSVSNDTSTATGTDALAASSSTSAAAAAAVDPPTKWYTNKWDTYWLWWVIGGYFVSSWLFNVADFVNQVVLPRSVFDEAGEGVVSQLINPENNDLAASFVGYIAPCCSAPIWEEVLYRGYMLPSLCLHMTFWPAVVVSGLIFSAHHMSATGFIPLTVLGMTWAALYAKSRNLLVTIIIHAMWNSRVFLGSWLGL